MTFAYERFVYSAIASVIGAIIGAALGALIVAGLSSLEDVTLTIKPSTLLLSGSAGLLISFITAFITSVRISRLNIVMAIRDLSEPEGNGPARWQSIAFPLVFILGALLTFMGFANANGYFQYIGLCVMLLSAAVVGRFLPPRLVFTLGGGAITGYSFLADRLDEVQILFDEGPGLFFITSIFMLLAGMMIISFNLSVVLWVVRLGSAGLKRLEPIIQIAVAYPAVNRMRTATTMGMLGLVLFGVTLLTMFNGLQKGFISASLDKAAGGFDVIVYNTGPNRIEDLESELQASGEVDETQIVSIMPVHRALVKFPDIKRPATDGEQRPAEAQSEDDNYVEDSVTGIVADFAAQQVFPLEARMARFDTDADAWAAIIADTNLALVSARYDGTEDGVSNPLLDPGDTVRLLNPATGDIVDKTVAGRLLTPIKDGLGLQFDTLGGVIVSTEAFQQDFAESSSRGDAPRLFVMTVTDDTDLPALGKQMEKALITTGAPVLSSVQNVELPLIIGGTPRREAQEQAKHMLELVGLGNRLDHRPMELSGGEQQRVAIARALVTTPAIVWADEPTGNLDSERSGEVMSLLKRLNKEHNQAMIMITHDSGIGQQADRIIKMRDGQIESDEQS